MKKYLRILLIIFFSIPTIAYASSYSSNYEDYAIGVGVKNDLLFVLYDGQKKQLGYCLVHLLGVGPSISYYPDITDQYKKVNLGIVGGVDYFDAYDIFLIRDLTNSVRISREKLPINMKSFVSLSFMGIGYDMAKSSESLEPILIKPAYYTNVYDDEFDNSEYGSYDCTLLCLYDGNNKLLGYSILKK